MNRRQMLLSTAALSASLPFPWRQALAAADSKRRVLFFTKSAGFEHSAIKREGDALSYAEQTLVDLGKQHGFDVHATKDGRVSTTTSRSTTRSCFAQPAI